jgi:hypothetical protein
LGSNIIGVLSGQERKAAAGEATKAMTGTQAATKGAGNKENKAAALKSIVKEAERKPNAAKNIKKPNGPKDKQDDKAKGDAGRVYAGAKPQLVTANKLTMVPTLSTTETAAVQLNIKANATAKDQKNDPVVKRVPPPLPAGFQFPASCAYNYNGSKATEVERKQEDASEGKQKEPVKTVPSPIPADVSSSCALDFNSSNATEVERKQEDAFEGVILDKHSEAVPQCNNEVAKENKEEEEFENQSFRHSGDQLGLAWYPHADELWRCLHCLRLFFL